MTMTLKNAALTQHQRILDKILGSNSVFNKIKEITKLTNPILSQLAAVNSINSIPKIAFSSPTHKVIQDLSSRYSFVFDRIIPNEVLIANDVLKDHYLQTRSFYIPDSIRALLRSESLTKVNEIQHQIDTLIHPISRVLTKNQVSLNSLIKFDAFESVKNQIEHIASMTLPYKVQIEALKTLLIPTKVVQTAIKMAEIQNSEIHNPINLTGMSSLQGIEASLRVAALTAIDMTASLIENRDADESLSAEHYRDLVVNDLSVNKTKNFDALGLIGLVLNIIIPIITTLYSIQMNNQATEDSQKALDALEVTLIREIYVVQKHVKELQDELSKNVQEKKIEYVVMRTVHLRTLSNTGAASHIITKLYPNQKVELLKRNKKWIYVGYFDHVEGIPKTGWVYKKYLKMIK